jgi:hypothetical protein
VQNQRAAGEAEAAAFFEAKVRPILISQCFACHSEGSGAAKGGLKLDSRANLLKGGGRGAAVVPGDPEGSLLIRALRHTDEGLKMPPSGKLRSVDLAALEAWVRSGAVWPPDPPRTASAATRPSARFWAFTAPKAAPLPSVKAKWWAGNPIDRLVLAKLEASGLKPAPPADRRTLIRRATFDLTGLPPTPAEIQAFLSDTRPNAFERVVDRLLGSSAYGERWARHWLDVARYADSNGVDENLVYTQAWRYRDYVVRSLNQNRPIDQFIHQQIAGDLLTSDPHSETDYDRIIATGYLSLGPKMLAEDDPVKQELDIIDEQIDTLGKTFMGLTLGCARCHDHKFDPIPQHDYYALAGIFKSTRTMLNFKNMAEWQEVALVSKAEQAHAEAVDAEISKKREARRSLVKTASEKVLMTERGRIALYRQAAQKAAQADRQEQNLLPVPTGSDTTPAGSKIIEAEDFASGNVLKDTSGFGRGIGVLVNAGQYPNRTEYVFDLPETGTYQLDLRYASGDPRPIRIYVNDRLVLSNAAAHTTGGFNPQNQKWFAEGVFRFTSGRNTLRLERDSYFPHIDKLLLTFRPGGIETQSLEQIAVDNTLVPEFLRQAVKQLDSRGNLQNGTPLFTLPDKPESLLSADLRGQVSRLDDEIAALVKSRPRLPRAMAVTEGKPAEMKVHLRGDYLNLGEVCGRGFPKVVKVANTPSIPPDRSGRLELAQWLTDPGHPLTARVFVNRVWRWHFGKGIVPTTDNFGLLGERPTNQPLLDWLARTFVADGWDLKRLHKRIMLSSTYQMSSRFDRAAYAKDPGNTLQWRFDRRRLEAEAIRDAILSVSGKLDRTMGGSLLTFQDRQYVTSTANSDPVKYNSNRRSLYLPVIRSALYDVYTAFDFGDPTVMNGDRPSTTVAPQALFMMNSSLVLENSMAMADRLLSKQGISDAERYRTAFEECFGRLPSAAEASRFHTAAVRLESAYAGAEPDPEKRRRKVWQSICKTLLAANEFIYID